MKNKLKKIYKLYKVLKDTEVIEGGRLWFIIYFIMTHFFNVLKSNFYFMKSSLLNISINNKKTFTIKNKTGIFLVRPYNDSFTISADYFEEDLRFWLDKMSDKKIFLDIGANIGRYSLLAINNFGYEKIVAIEANPITFNILSKNIELNNLKNKSILINMAVGDREGSIGFQSDSMHLGGGKVLAGGNSENNWDKKIEVKMNTVDDLLIKSSVISNDISFIKMDVEGFEKNVISGMKKTLASLSVGSCFMLEISDENIDLIKEIEGFGFRLKNHQNNDYLFIKS